MSSTPISNRAAWRSVLLRLARSRPVRLLWSVAFFVGAAYLIYRQIAAMLLSALVHAVATTNPIAVVGSISLTCASYLCLSGSEWLALKALGHRLGYWRAARVAVPAYALTNSAGFSPATGTALRIQLYSPMGLSAFQSTQVAMLAGAAVTISGVVAAGAVIILDPSIGRALRQSSHVVPLVGGLMIAPVALWFVAFKSGAPAWLGGGKAERLPTRDRVLGLGAGLGDWTFSAAALFLLLPHPDPATFAGYFVAYTAGCILSAATGVPGGIGVFEAIVLSLTSVISKTHETAAALLLYRCIYSLGPLALAAAFGGIRRVAGSRRRAGTDAC